MAESRHNTHQPELPTHGARRPSSPETYHRESLARIRNKAWRPSCGRARPGGPAGPVGSCPGAGRHAQGHDRRQSGRRLRPDRPLPGCRHDCRGQCTQRHLRKQGRCRRHDRPGAVREQRTRQRLGSDRDRSGDGRRHRNRQATRHPEERDPDRAPVCRHDDPGGPRQFAHPDPEGPDRQAQGQSGIGVLGRRLARFDRSHHGRPDRQGCGRRSDQGELRRLRGWRRGQVGHPGRPRHRRRRGGVGVRTGRGRRTHARPGDFLELQAAQSAHAQGPGRERGNL